MSREKPIYMLDFAVEGCGLEVRVNDLYVMSSMSGGIAGYAPINDCIASSGKQEISFDLFPLDGEETLPDDIGLRLDIHSVMVDTDDIAVTEPELVASIARAEGQEAGIAAFNASVPYTLNLAQDARPLTSDLETLGRLVQFYQTFNETLASGDIDAVMRLIRQHEDNTATCNYWEMTDDLRRARLDDFAITLREGCSLLMPEDDERLRLYGGGRLCRLVTPDGSPALTFHTSVEDNVLDWYFYIPQGSNEFMIL